MLTEDAIVEQLRAIKSSIPPDLNCDPAIGARVIIAPRPDNEVPIEVAAWGVTYRALCVDPVTLGKFAREHYNQGPEDSCLAGGVTDF